MRLPPEVAYNEDFYQQKPLRKWARRFLSVLPPEVETLVSTGSSGCTIATAMQILSKRPLCHKHIKQSKKAHTQNAGFSKGISAFVDDFIDTGNTLQFVIDAGFKPKYAITGSSTDFIRCKSLSLTHISARDKCVTLPSSASSAAPQSQQPPF